ncbi:hypothetical protein B0H13DRAFT_2345723 [Mycena leptocephala]|nr:hypothetical protein B0H13DRAFT_2345723 [Mycena leptocephala]
MSDGHLDHGIMANLAEIHKFKSEYAEARNIHFRILQETSVTQDFYAYGVVLLNVAEIDVAIGAPKEDVQELTAPLGTADKINDLSDIEDMKGLDLEDETAPDPVAL